MSEERTFLVVVHTLRKDVDRTVEQIRGRLDEAGVRMKLESDVSDAPDDAAFGCEVVVVLGGDGGFLRGAELARRAGVPIVGINLGHVGFLAESEMDSVASTIDDLLARRYTVQPRMTLDVEIHDGTDLISQGWALNEVSVENRSRQGLLELVTEVDDRPVSRFACDGVLVATPTGSTAYAFSAGGPVMWPDLEALLIVPSNAHALFARPMVTSPRSTIAIEVEGSRHEAIAFCDGRRTLEVPERGRVEIRRGAEPVRFIKLGAAPFTDRLVHKFELPITGWRGRGDGTTGSGG
ncbi:NAD kinase [Tsukamurella strandjordii]|uniref:NAD kinase n=1 Tax=Tsukamurella TaxID=2060 RepID=UPI001C7CB561|nr:NAD kinase [Tsukamurella sp. TY48]GIZ98564.1 NAD kinase [Tsukamurella sp. TY48]